MTHFRQRITSFNSRLPPTSNKSPGCRARSSDTVNSDLLFAPGSWKIRPQGEAVIANLAKKLAPTQQNHLIVSGYTDNAPIGPALQREGVTSNQELSQKRADAVMQYLISQGVKPELISAQGFGDASPVASNDTAQGRAQNRRVELSLGAPAS